MTKIESLKKQFEINFNAMKLFMAFPKQVLLSKTLSTVLRSAIPFVNIWFSAHILNELAGARNQERLVQLVLLTIALNLIASLLGQAFARWEEYCGSTVYSNLFYYSMEKIFNDKLLSMDYIDIETPEVQQAYASIRQHHRGMNSFLDN